MHLQRKELEVLALLSSYGCAAVSRQAFIAAVWDGNSLTGDRGINDKIFVLRRALSDVDSENPLIRTIPRRGYQLTVLAQLQKIDESPLSESELVQLEVQNTTSCNQVFRFCRSEPYLGVSEPTKASNVAALPAHEEVVAPIAETKSGVPAATQIAAVTLISETGSTPPVRQHPARKLPVNAWLALALVIVAVISWKLPITRAPDISAPRVGSMNTGAPLARLQEEIRKGQFEEVRKGLLKLPVQLAESSEASMLEIQLDIDRGRWQFASEKLVREQARAAAAADPIWRAKLYLLQSRLNYRNQGLDALAPAQSAIDLLESIPDKVSAQLLAEALSYRGKALLEMDQLDDAARDQVRARDLYLSVDEKLLAAAVSGSLARVWMRRGRLVEALNQITVDATIYAQFHDPIKQILAHNTALRIQVELLRWPDALASNDQSMQFLQPVPDFERRHRVLQLRALVLSGLGRLREAGSLLEEAEAERPGRTEIIPAVYYLAGGQTEQALRTATAAFATSNNGNMSDVLFENRDGALVLWMTAAQRHAAEGKPMPAPSTEQLAVLQNAESNAGHIARGRWLWALGKSQEAEVQLRLSLAQARQMNLLYRMLLASEPLVELLLERGETAAAAQVLADLRAHDPASVDQDYQANVLGLQVALAVGSRSAIAAAYRRTAGLAGERVLPTRISMAYEASMRVPNVGMNAGLR